MVVVDVGNESYNFSRQINALQEKLRKATVDKDKYITSNLSLAKEYQKSISLLRKTLANFQVDLLDLKQKYATQRKSLREVIMQIDDIKEKLKATGNKNNFVEKKETKIYAKHPTKSSKSPTIVQLGKSSKDDSSVLKFIKF